VKTGTSFQVNETAKNVLDYRFPREERLKGREEIRKVFSERKSVTCPGARLFSLRNGLPFNRIVFAFPRKFGNAVKRNRSRRVSREAYRFLRKELHQGHDLVLLVYPGSGRDVLSGRMNQLKELFLMAGLLKSKLNGKNA